MKFTHETGTRPLDGYTIKHGIGRGGFGEVYHAVSDGGKEVALKLVQRHLDVELRGVGHCLNLKHANLVGLYDVKKTEAGDSWVVMEYINGEGLDKVIARHQQGLPVEQALAWFRAACEGVRYLHGQGIVHRDLKPGNIFLENGAVKIGDYGLAKFISASRRSGQTESIGTVQYMAPEVSRGRYGKAIDLYALGVVFFEMLSGRLPFDGETAGEILMKHLTAAPELYLLPAAFRPVVGRLLEKDPDQRYSSVESLLAHLESLFPTGSAVPSGRVVEVAYPAPPLGGSEAAFPVAVPVPSNAPPRRLLDVPSPELSAGSVASPFDRLLDAAYRHFVVLFLGTGVGLLVAGVALAFASRGRDDHVPFLAVGSGFLVSGLAALNLFRSPDGRLRWRGSVALFLGTGVGMFVAGLAASLFTRPDHDSVPFLAIGAGFLTTAGLFVYFGTAKYLFGLSDPPPTDAPLAARADSRRLAGVMSDWHRVSHQSARGMEASMVAHPLLWSVGILLVLRMVFYAAWGVSISFAALFCAAAFVWGKLKPPEQPAPPPEPKRGG
jgi:hypothetical protein